MKKILFIIPSLSNGGAEKVVSQISSGLCNENYEVAVLVFFNHNNSYELNDNIKLINLSNGYEEEYNRISKINRLKKIRKKIKEFNPDIIIPFLDHICIYTYFSTVFSKYTKKIVFTERNNPKFLNKKLVKVKKILQYLFIKKIIVQNHGQFECLPKKVQNKTYIISNPISFKYLVYEKELNDIPIHLISIGRLLDQKDYPLAINAFNNVLKKYPNLIYHIYGKGEDKDKIEKLIKELNLEGKVKLEGFTTDINKVYENADIYLMTSKFEGMPNALAESMAVGIPSISIDCEFGPSDLIDNENMGILVKEHTIEAVEKALLYMIENYNIYSFKSKYVKERMKERYSLDKITNEWIKVIEDI